MSGVKRLSEVAERGTMSISRVASLPGILLGVHGFAIGFPSMFIGFIQVT